MQTVTQTVTQTEQLPLLGPDLTPIIPIPRAKLSLDERFRAFHAANPQVYALFRRLTWDLFTAGRGRIGAKMVWERLRWEYALATDDDGWKLNNDFTSRYARLLMDNEPALAGVFETRELRS